VRTRPSVIIALLCGILGSTPADAKRTVAITVDDLPFVGPPARDNRTVVANMRKLVTQVKSVGVPVVGFVVGRRLGDYDALRIWRDAGLPLGNHTFSHRRYSKNSIARYLSDIRRNEEAIHRGLKVDLRGGWFRFPYLDHGHTAKKVDAVVAYLKKRRYRMAPVSLDTVDYAFNAYYARASTRSQKQRVVQMYVDHVAESAKHFESLSRKLYGREIPLVLLVHANPLNADHLRKVLATLKDRGYSFVTLEQALADKAYTEHGLRPPHVPLDGDRNFLNQVALSRGLKLPDPSGDAHFRKHWKPLLERLNIRR